MSIKKFNKASLAMAVAGALAASSAQAVNIAEDGLGEAIIAPYYTVNDGWNTYISVHNTSEETVVFKIRFRELYDSRDARDFNVVLSPFDVWTAALVEDASGAARLVTHDRSCTVPAYIRDSGIAFTNAAYTGIYADGGPTDLGRTTEGYFEIFNMGQDSEISDGIDNDSDLAWWAEHVDGEPRSCASAEAEFLDMANLRAEFDEPENVLKVNVAMIQVEDGMGISYDPVTLANFYNPALTGPVDAMSTGDLMFEPASVNPNVTSTFPNISEIHTNAVGANLVSDFTAGIAAGTASLGDPVSALFMRNAVINQFRVEDGAADTDWVVTFPTKWVYTDLDFGLAPVIPYEPFVEAFIGESCVTVVARTWDREERAPDVVYDIPPSPYVPEDNAARLCHEVNVIEYGNGVLMGQDTYDAGTSYSAGWTRLDLGLDFDGAGLLINWIADDAGIVYQGLPVIGIAASNLDNAVVGNENVQYGFAWNHSYTRSIDVGTGISATYTNNGMPMGPYDLPPVSGI